MGYNATVVVMLDALHAIERDAEFGAKLSRAISRSVCQGAPTDVSACNHCNAATVIEAHHADRLVPVLVGGNNGQVVGVSVRHDDGPEELLRALANHLGYRLARKPTRKAV